MEIIERNLYLDKIRDFIDKPLIKVLVGIRRAGKSTLLESIEKILIEKGTNPEKIIHINFEHLSYANIRNREGFTQLIEDLVKNQKKHYFLFDEIQNIEGWDEVLNGLLAEYKADIYITGSNSKLLSRELSTFLTGRFINIEVFPLNFKEYLDFKQSLDLKIENDSAEFSNFLQSGGFPILHANNFSLEQGDDVVTDIYNSIIFRDIIERHGVRNSELLERTVKFIFDNIGNTFSAKSVSDYLKNEKRKLNPETIYEYLNWLEEAFVIRRINRYDLRGKEILKTNEKYFLGDISLLYAINGRQDSYISGILENIILNELLSQGWKVTVGKNMTQEIDFVATKKQQKIYLQIAKTIEDKQTMTREINAFQGINDNYPKFILCLDSVFGDNLDGIEVWQIAKWLKEKLPNLA